MRNASRRFVSAVSFPPFRFRRFVSAVSIPVPLGEGYQENLRLVTVRVLPVPAPARIMTGPSSAASAWRWAEFRESNENEEAN